MNNSYYAAILTLYNDECQIDEKAQREYINFLLEKKVKGFFPCGTSGEYTNLSKSENLSILRMVFVKYVKFYKKYRGFYKEAILYLSGDPQNVGDRDGFCHLQYHREETDEHLVFCYRFATACNTDIVYLKNIEEQEVYVLEDAVSGELVAEYTGEDLMHRGLEIRYETRHSGKILFVRKK